MVKYKIKGKVWLYEGPAAWHFFTIPATESAEIKARFGIFQKSWGTLPATITTGKTTWQTSLFFDTKADAYLLPVKASVRKKENIKTDQTIEILLQFED